jgi:hypothetical protein
VLVEDSEIELRGRVAGLGERPERSERRREIAASERRLALVAVREGRRCDAEQKDGGKEGADDGRRYRRWLA